MSVLANSLRRACYDLGGTLRRRSMTSYFVT